jgi:hypothetical protein
MGKFAVGKGAIGFVHVSGREASTVRFNKDARFRED